MTRPTRKPFLKAAAVAAVIILALLAVLFWLFGVPTSEGAGFVSGRLVFTFTPGVLLAGWLARRSREAWSLWRIGMTVLAVTVPIMLVTSAPYILNASAPYLGPSTGRP